MQNRPPVDQIHYLRRQSTQFYLLAGGTALLLAWLSVGLTPSTWGLLFQIISQFKMLWTQQSVNTLWALLLLIGQSLLLLAAWVLLIGIVIRESVYLRALLPVSPPPTPTAYAAMPVPPPVEAATLVLSQPAPVTFGPPPPPPPPSTWETASATEQITLIPDQVKAQDVSPLAQMLRIDEQCTVVSPRSFRKTRLSPSTPSAQVKPPGAAKQASEMPTQIRPPSTPDTSDSSSQQGSDLYEGIGVFGQEEQIPFPEPQQIPQTQIGQQEQQRQQKPSRRPKWQDEDVLSNPFAPNEDVLGLSLQEKLLQGASDHMEQTQPTPQDSEQDEVFVFGNPFEGALPDVFEHDEDLKRSLLEQSDEGQASPGPGKDKTNTPSKPK